MIVRVRAVIELSCKATSDYELPALALYFDN